MDIKVTPIGYSKYHHCRVFWDIGFIEMAFMFGGEPLMKLLGEIV